MATRGKSPRRLTFVICLVLYVVALLSHFNIVNVPNGLGDWSWIIGYGVILLAIQLRGL